jgi:hypothetical protein
MLRQQVCACARQAQSSHAAILRCLAPLAYAVVLAAVIGGAAFAAQALVLPRPSRALLLAVQADRWLVRHRVVRSVDQIGPGPRFRAACVETWLGPAAPQIPHRGPGAVLFTSQGAQLIAVHREVLRVGAHLADDEGRSELARFELAGCPWVLGSELGAMLDARLSRDFARTRVDGQLALRFGLVRPKERVELFVQPNSFRPLAVHVSALHLEGWSRIRPGGAALASRLVRRFRALTKQSRTGLL